MTPNASRDRSHGQREGGYLVLGGGDLVMGGEVDGFPQDGKVIDPPPNTSTTVNAQAGGYTSYWNVFLFTS